MHKSVIHISLVTVVTTTDYPKPVRNRRVIEFLVVLCFALFKVLLLWISLDILDIFL